MNDEQKLTCSLIHSHYGANMQLVVLQEECAELIQAVSKIQRYGINHDTYDNFVEELADVSIMIQQMKSWLHNDWTGEIEAKLQRQKERISNERHSE